MFLQFLIFQVVVGAGPVKPAGKPESAKKRSSCEVSTVTKSHQFKAANIISNTNFDMANLIYYFVS